MRTLYLAGTLPRAYVRRARCWSGMWYRAARAHAAAARVAQSLGTPAARQLAAWHNAKARKAQVRAYAAAARAANR